MIHAAGIKRDPSIAIGQTSETNRVLIRIRFTEFDAGLSGIHGTGVVEHLTMRELGGFNTKVPGGNRHRFGYRCSATARSRSCKFW